ncbi:MAG: hypothetical protein K6G85_04835 [Eubacterium sp.]|nr:hypothetical protein [Eubacterium sp.]
MEKKWNTNDSQVEEGSYSSKSGSQIILEKLKFKGQIGLILGGFFLIIVLMYFHKNPFIVDGGLGREKIEYFPMMSELFMVFKIGIVLAICLIILYSADLLRGEKSFYVKRRKNYIFLADDLFSEIVYQDEYIIISKKAFARKNEITVIFDVDDIVATYNSLRKERGIVERVVIQLKNGKEIAIRPGPWKKEEKNQMRKTIAKYCPNCKEKIGFL